MTKISVFTLTETYITVPILYVLQQIVTCGEGCTLKRIAFDSKRLKAYAAL
jgi:hypothetical protein